MIVSLAAAAMLGIVALLFPRYGPDDQILTTTGIFGGFSLVAMLCAVVLEKRRAVPFMWLGVVSAALAFVAWVVLVWYERSMSYDAQVRVARIGGTFTTISILCAQSGLLGLLRFDHPAARFARRATVAVSIVLAACLLVLIWFFEQIMRMMDDEIVGRALGVLAILTACGTVVSPILWKVQSIRRSVSGESIPSRVRIEMTCPRCHERQTLPAGRRRCASCGLRIVIEVEEPRCACGYLLHRLESNHCPECGREVPERDRWAAVE